MNPNRIAAGHDGGLHGYDAPEPMTKGPAYVIERWPHGWLLCKPTYAFGIPVSAFSEALKLFPKKGALVQLGIPHHMKTTGKSPLVMMCIATEREGGLWRAEIEKEIAGLPMPERWYRGLDVGESSLVIYHMLREGQCSFSIADERFPGETPRDASDFASCARLLAAMPEWKARLPEVAAAYPKTDWPKIIARWDEIAAATPEEQGKILRTL